MLYISIFLWSKSLPGCQTKIFLLNKSLLTLLNSFEHINWLFASCKKTSLFSFTSVKTKGGQLEEYCIHITLKQFFLSKFFLFYLCDIKFIKATTNNTLQFTWKSLLRPVYLYEWKSVPKTVYKDFALQDLLDFHKPCNN